MLTSRRKFIKDSSLLIGASTLPMTIFEMEENLLKKIGIQLFSIPKLLEKDFTSAIKLLSDLGYSELELFGPYHFSHENGKQRWAAVTGALGFKGSGYFGKNMEEVKSILNDHNMTAPSAHTDLDTLIHNMGELGEASHNLGHKYVTLPAIPDDKRNTLNDYYKIAELFNVIGENARKEGIKFAYHNHGYGIKPMADGTVPLEIIIEHTDPELVFLEMDVFWTAAGGADPVAMLQKYPSRYHLLHIKDMKPKTTFSGDGGDASQWIALFPLMVAAGSGELNVGEIIRTGVKTGVKHFFVEQDMVAKPEVELKKSIDFLANL